MEVKKNYLWMITRIKPLIHVVDNFYGIKTLTINMKRSWMEGRRDVGAKWPPSTHEIL